VCILAQSLVFFLSFFLTHLLTHSLFLYALNYPQQVDEQQVITCKVPSDNFQGAQISFVYKESQGPTISLQPGGTTPTTAADLKANLESIPGIRKVNIDTQNPSTDTLARMCTTAGNNLVVTFLTEHGDLPLLQPVYLPASVTGFAVAVTPYTTGQSFFYGAHHTCQSLSLITPIFSNLTPFIVLCYRY